MSYYPTDGFLEAVSSGKQTPGAVSMRTIAKELLEMRQVAVAQAAIARQVAADREELLKARETLSEMEDLKKRLKRYDDKVLAEAEFRYADAP